MDKLAYQLGRLARLVKMSEDYLDYNNTPYLTPAEHPPMLMTDSLGGQSTNDYRYNRHLNNLATRGDTPAELLTQSGQPMTADWNERRTQPEVIQSPEFIQGAYPTELDPPTPGLYDSVPGEEKADKQAAKFEAAQAARNGSAPTQPDQPVNYNNDYMTEQFGEPAQISSGGGKLYQTPYGLRTAQGFAVQQRGLQTAKQRTMAVNPGASEADVGQAVDSYAMRGGDIYGKANPDNPGIHTTLATPMTGEQALQQQTAARNARNPNYVKPLPQNYQPYGEGLRGGSAASEYVGNMGRAPIDPRSLDPNNFNPRDPRQAAAYAASQGARAQALTKQPNTAEMRGAGSAYNIAPPQRSVAEAIQAPGPGGSRNPAMPTATSPGGHYYLPKPTKVDPMAIKGNMGTTEQRYANFRANRGLPQGR